MMRLLARYTVIVLLSSPLSLGAANKTIGPGEDINSAVQGLSAGDTLLLKAGQYGAFSNPPSGVTIAGDPADGPLKAVLSGGSGSGNFIDIGSGENITLNNLVIDGSGAGSAALKITGSATKITVSNCEIKNGGTQGILAANSGHLFSNLKVHDNGGQTDNLDHGIYLQGTDMIVENSEFYNNKLGFGIHVYNGGGESSRITLRGNRVHDNKWAIVMGSGDDNIAYNNLIWNNGEGIFVSNGGNNAQVYNNTIVDNGTGQAEHFCIKDVNSATVIRNNICWGNPSNDVQGGDSATVSNNLVDDPLFVDASSGDYRLKEGSPAIKAGVDLSSIFTTDITGATRPSGPFDIGAYAFGATAPGGETPPPPGGQVSLPPTKNLRLLKPQPTSTSTSTSAPTSTSTPTP
jgi:parallel beta-helix repeat protein